MMLDKAQNFTVMFFNPLVITVRDLNRDKMKKMSIYTKKSIIMA